MLQGSSALQMPDSSYLRLLSPTQPQQTAGGDLLSAESSEGLATLLASLFDTWVLDANMQTRDRDGEIRDRTATRQALASVKIARQALDDACNDPQDLMVFCLAGKLTKRTPQELLEGLLARLFPLDEDGIPDRSAYTLQANQPLHKPVHVTAIVSKCRVCTGELGDLAEQHAGKCSECLAQECQLRRVARGDAGRDYYEGAAGW